MKNIVLLKTKQKLYLYYKYPTNFNLIKYVNPKRLYRNKANNLKKFQSKRITNLICNVEKSQELWKQ